MGCGCGKVTVVEDPERPAGSQSSASKAKVSVPKDVIEKKVTQAKKTRVLALRECGLKTLPSDATSDEASAFRTVDLTSNLLKALPESIGCWTSLQTLQCGDNALTELPPAVGQLASLQKLVLSTNKLSALPKEISMLGKVKVLQLDANCLGPQLPSDIFGSALPASLEELDLSGNGLEDVPSSVAGLDKLVRLVLSRNKIAALPQELGGLAKLQYLDAADNMLTAIPEAIIACPNLNELWLKGNPVNRLALQETPGFNEFLERRKQRLDARIDANVVGRMNLAVCGLE
eukprot:TRINITY_DN65733_c0_g1_i1.p1 TRINITY_DN65733_c0_g1~~TRINITY_DN65733_c0_g1_i1.p1  ORF type:complete len:289 (-),score=80.99 TRINITY_DN65733_c0_g1_i1:113-979(-)